MGSNKNLAQFIELPIMIGNMLEFRLPSQEEVKSAYLKGWTLDKTG